MIEGVIDEINFQIDITSFKTVTSFLNLFTYWPISQILQVMLNQKLLYWKLVGKYIAGSR